MAGSSEIKYRVSVDSSRANRALTQFSRAAQQAGEDAVSALDDTSSAGDKARAAIEAMAESMDSQMRDAAAAAEALATALGPELTSRLDVDTVIGDLNRMGVSFDEIRGDADKFAGTLKRIDETNLKQVDAGVDRLGRSLQDTRGEADQSRSVLANMSGNAAGELAEVAGATGPLNVALGQLAEYATEGNIKMGNLAAIAAPMAALGLAVAGVSKFMQEQQRIDAWRKEQVEGYAAAVEDVGVGLGAVEQHLSNVAGQTFETASGMTEFLIGGDQVENVAAAFGVLGINVKDVSRAIAAGASDTEAGEAGLAELEAQLEATGLEHGAYKTLLEFVTEQQDAYSEATHNSAAENKFWAASAGDITGAMSKNSVALGATETLWGRLLRDLRDGHIDTVNATEAWNELRDSLGLTDEAMAEVVQQKLDEQLVADTKAAEDLAAGIVAAAQAAGEYNQTVGSAEFGAATIEAAETAMSGFFETAMQAGDEIGALDESYEGLAEAVLAANEAGVDWTDIMSSVSTGEGRAVRSALRSLGNDLIPDITDAFADSHGDIEVFRTNMNRIATQTLVRLQEELGIGEEDAKALLEQLGLTPEQIETQYKLIGDEEAKAKLALLQGSIDALPENVQTQVTQKIILGDYQGALAIVQEYYNRTGASVPVDADMTQAYQALAEFAQAVRGARIVAQVAASFPRSVGQSSSTSTAPTSAAARGVGAAPMAAGPSTLNVHVHTAVVGNRYDVERVVSGAVRNSVRLAGRRQLQGAAR